MTNSRTPIATKTTAETTDVSDHPQLGVAAIIMGVVAFFSGSSIFIILGGTPPSSTPIASVLGHMGWFVSVACLGIGTVAILMDEGPSEPELAGYLAIGALGLGSLCGLLWTTWAWVDVLAAQQDQYERLLKAIIAPLGSGLALMYGLLVGSGIGFLGWEIRHRSVAHPVVGWIGVAIGTLAVLGNGAVLVSVSKGILFASMVLLVPLFYLWALVLAVEIYR